MARLIKLRNEAEAGMRMRDPSPLRFRASVVAGRDEPGRPERPTRTGVGAPGYNSVRQLGRRRTINR